MFNFVEQRVAATPLAHIYSYAPASLVNSLAVAAAFVTLVGLAATVSQKVRDILVFSYTCFLQPLGKTSNQAERLDKFYQNQASVYDATRSGLLKGRTTMLKLCAAQLRDMQATNPGKPLIWVDIGGGTGWNIEQMNEHFPIDQLAQVYLIDLCEPLLEVARKRFAAKGFKNVQVLCQDASQFNMPGLAAGQKVDLFTCSYSISMIPPFYAVLDRINDFLDPVTGVFGVVDFYVSGKSAPTSKSPMIGGDTRRQCGWLSRWFWSMWFSLDHIELHPARRDYLEHKFGTIKCYNGRNNFIIPLIVRIPYYIWLGVSRERDTTKAIQAFEVESGNRVVVPPSFPELAYLHDDEISSKGRTAIATGIDACEDASSRFEPTRRFLRRRVSEATNESDADSDRPLKLDLGPHIPLSSFHYQKRQWRLPFVDNEFSDMFRTWIYGFTWEDPYVDMQHINLGRDDSILCITSAGDNALHYAVAGKPRRIHAVDMNPCQGHLLELKLACIASLTYDEMWAMFGEGRIDNFRELLDSKISPYLSSHAYQFWRLNTRAFETAFYFRGYSGHALRLAKYAFTITGVRRWVAKMCTANSVEEQQDVWNKKLRSTLINKPLIRLFLSNPAFLWNALGVPMNQYQIFLNEGVSAEQFAIDTLDSIPSRSLIKNDNYHYQLCLMHKYTKQSCPLYLKPDGFAALKKQALEEGLDSFRLHTDSIVNVLRGFEDGALTRAITMDHMDWFDPVPESQPAPTIKQARKDEDKTVSDLDREICELSRVVRKGGMVFYRSAAKRPWYNQRFEKMGFRVEPVHIRETGKPIDNVNMYASFYKATRL
ncbi:Methyltransferase domain protein [Kalmanozyma brasiliensis GHG001]|uniref:Methyltransferase domain-containing protein n=1 Tax=Kalmanozyma brasiliensis (strain GHG001) TaxID=1365824 RepID=V5EVJ2_KALBG|nr:Methyltransferase domain protein [Kalmanozyma brasiliensis GHG001]EST06244.1 Methyltransferase domain protein [Kalmanozyma brasiliensis GHG001]